MASASPVARAMNSPASFYKRHPRGKPLTSSQKQTVMNVYSQLRQRDPSRSIAAIAKDTGLLCGVSDKAIFRTRNEFNATGGLLKTPLKKRPVKKANNKTRMEKYDEFTLSAIRNKVHDFYRVNETPTVEKVRRAVNEDDDAPCDAGFGICFP